MPTRELIHVSFGSLPAHLSAQYFNIQTGYFDYSPSAPLPQIDHDVAWQEGLDGRGQARYTPRWLAFDVRDGFQGLRREEVAMDEEDDDDEVDEEDDQPMASGSTSSNWISKPQVMRTYQSRQTAPFRSLTNRERRGETVDWEEELEKEFASDEEDESHEPRGDQGVQPSQQQAAPSKPAKGRHSRPSRPWSSRLLFESHPKSLIPVTASGNLPLVSMPTASGSSSAASSAQGIESFESFEQGWSRAQAWDREHDTLDTHFRSQLESSDQPQGFNVLLQSTDAWSGFSAWHMEQLADEHPKLERLAWSMRLGELMGQVQTMEDGEVDEAAQRLARIRSMNEALTMLYLIESASLYTPMSLPDWPTDEGINAPSWTQHISQDKRTRLYEDESYMTAILASQFETATLGMRLRDSPTSASTLTSHLNWRGDTRLGSLGGCLPTPLLAPVRSGFDQPLDPVEALLAAKGYNPRPSWSDGASRGGRYDPQEAARTGAREIAKYWTDFSQAPQLLSAQSSRRKLADRAPTSTPSSSPVKPFAMHSVARDDQSGAKDITTASMQEWINGKESGSLQLEEPWVRSLFAPLAQPVPLSTPHLFTGLSSQGRPYPSSKTTRPTSLPLLSTLSTTPTSLAHIESCLSFLRSTIYSHSPLTAFGLGGSSATMSSGQAANDEIEGIIGGRDGIKELLERGEELRGAYEEEGHRRGEESDEEKGTDEEWEDGSDDLESE